MEPRVEADSARFSPFIMYAVRARARVCVCVCVAVVAPQLRGNALVRVIRVSQARTVGAKGCASMHAHRHTASLERVGACRCVREARAARTSAFSAHVCKGLLATSL